MVRTPKTIKGWMLFDSVTGNAFDITSNPELAKIWEEDARFDQTFVVIEFEEEVKYMAKEDKNKQEELEVEPGDDVEEVQPSIEREDAAIGSTGGSGAGSPGESGGIGQAGNPGGGGPGS